LHRSCVLCMCVAERYRGTEWRLSWFATNFPLGRGRRRRTDLSNRKSLCVLQAPQEPHRPPCTPYCRDVQPSLQDAGSGVDQFSIGLQDAGGEILRSRSRGLRGPELRLTDGMTDAHSSALQTISRSRRQRRHQRRHARHTNATNQLRHPLTPARVWTASRSSGRRESVR
jgi:hypothetical protein